MYSPCHIILKSITFSLDIPAEDKNVKRASIFVFKGVSIKCDDVKMVYKGQNDYYHIGFSFVACVDLIFSNIYMEGLMYGMLFNYCRNISGYNSKAVRCRHAYTPAQATINVNIEKLRGEYCHSVMDAHQAFNVHYKDVVDTLATQFPNCRALGTEIENANIYISKQAYQDYAYWSVQSLTKEYESIYKEIETRFYKVNFVVSRPSAFNGLTSFTCRKFIVEDCTTSSVAYYGNQNTLEKVSIKNSKIGIIRIDAQKTEINNTILDGYLFPNARYVLRFTGTGTTKLNNVTIQNFNASTTYLFDAFYNQPAINRLIINNSTIGKLRGFTNKLIYPGRQYENIELNNTVIAEFQENVNTEFPKVRDHIRLQKNPS